MALQEKHRSSIYQSLVPLLGEEEVADLLAQFPATDLDAPATKDYVGQQIAGVRVEMHQLANRMIVVLVSAMIGTAAVTVSAVGLIVANVR